MDGIELRLNWCQPKHHIYQLWRNKNNIKWSNERCKRKMMWRWMNYAVLVQFLSITLDGFFFHLFYLWRMSHLCFFFASNWLQFRKLWFCYELLAHLMMYFVLFLDIWHMLMILHVFTFITCKNGMMNKHVTNIDGVGIIFILLEWSSNSEIRKFHSI